jgi:cytochrome c biogenesis protein CcdA
MNEQKNAALVAKIILSFFMVIVYTGIGFLVIKFSELLPWLSSGFRVALGALLLLYGFFRLVRLFKAHFQNQKYYSDTHEE